MNETGAGTQDNALVSLELTAAMREAAKDAVEAKCALDRGLEEQRQHVFRGEEENAYQNLRLRFDTPQGMHQADCLLHGLAMADGGQRLGFRQEWKQARENSMAPLQQHVQAQIQKLETAGPAGHEVKARLEADLQRLTKTIAVFDGDLAAFYELPDEATPTAFIEPWKRLNEGLSAGRQIEQDVNRDLRKAIADTNTKELGLVPFSSVMPGGNLHARVGVVGSDWLSWPLKNFARKITAFCGKVDSINTHTTIVSMSAGCLRECKVYRVVWTECGLIRAELPADADWDSPEDVELQNRFKSLAIAFDNILEIVAPAEPPATQPKTIVRNVDDKAASLPPEGQWQPVETHLDNPPAAAASVETEPSSSFGDEHDADGVAKAPAKTLMPQPRATTPNTAAEVAATGPGRAPQPSKPTSTSTAADTEPAKPAVSPSHTPGGAYDEISVTKAFYVFANGTKIRDNQKRLTLLGLATFDRGDGADGFEVLPVELIKLCDGPHVDPDRYSDRYGQRLKPFATGQTPLTHFKRDEHWLSGLRFHLDAGVGSESITQFLARHHKPPKKKSC